MDVFVPHWQVGGEVGIGYDLGEAAFGDLVTPTFQLTGAYHFNEFIAARLAISGITSKNEYSFPHEKYSWNFIQPAIDVKLDLASLFYGWNPENKFTPYIFAGVGAAIAFNNDDAQKASQKFGVEFEKLWKDSRFNPVLRGGVGCEYWFNETTALTLEANANMLPDHYNSKRGKRDNRDWRFNAAIGMRIRLGEYNRKTDALYEQARAQQQIAQQAAAQPRITKAQTDLTVNIQFTINQSIIRPSELQKLGELTNFLIEHPNSHALLVGYADKETGNPTINERLSRERAAAVAAYLRSRGISSDRLHTDHKGDRIQPFDFPAENRVCICIVLNPKYL